MCKRLFDIVASFIGIALLGVPMVLIALTIIITDFGPVLFKQVRVGRGGKEFRIFKFRTMVVNAEKLGSQITVGRDPRITRIGALLRKTKMDELPQLFNVLFGSMSLVGPRPEVPKYVAMYNEEQRRVLEVTPGITDLAAIKYHKESELLAEAGDDWEDVYVNQIMPDKLRLNLEYIDKRSFLSDIKLIFATLLRII